MFLRWVPDFETPEALFLFTDSLRSTVFQDKYSGQNAQACLSALSEDFEAGCYCGDRYLEKWELAGGGSSWAAGILHVSSPASLSAFFQHFVWLQGCKLYSCKNFTKWNYFLGYFIKIIGTEKLMSDLWTVLKKILCKHLQKRCWCWLLSKLQPHWHLQTNSSWDNVVLLISV